MSAGKIKNKNPFYYLSGSIASAQKRRAVKKSKRPKIGY
jgi:hypothetical protein